MNKLEKILGKCYRCGTIPSKIEGKGTLYIWFPVAHSLNKITSALDKAEVEYQIPESGDCFQIVLDKDKESFFKIITTKLTNKELKETQVLWMLGEAEPQFRDFARVTTLNQLISFANSEWLLDLLAEERLTCHFQPIAYAEDTSKIFGQESLLRGFDGQGNTIYPDRIFSQAQDAGLVFQLDAFARQAAIREANKHGIKEQIFINFSPTAVYDPSTCLRMTVHAISEAGIPHNQVVFELMESEQPPDIKHLIKILKFYRDAGFLIALDDFGTGYSNLNLIYELSPDFLKLDRHLLSNVHQDTSKAFIAEKILEIAQRFNIKTIAEGIESVEELDWVRQRGATLVQGFLIAKPSTPPLTTTPKITS